MGPGDLEKVLSYLPSEIKDPALLVGMSTGDDAGVYRITDDLALVQTVDFFTPVVDDPYWFGAVAAANALSDIYAMGARPVTALNLVSFPTSKIPLSVLGEILQGGHDKITEAGVRLLGGHSIDDPEPKYGMAVTGLVHPDRIWTNARARTGDVLVLTKGIGAGLLTTAAKRNLISERELTDAVAVMATLNRGAARVASGFTVNACTDVTGFGLLGHAWEMARASGITMTIDSEKVPLLPGARELLTAGAFPGGTRANLSYLSPHVVFDPDISEEMRLVLADAMTSGGLLLSIPAGEGRGLIKALLDNGVRAEIVGEVGPGKPAITVS